LDTGVALVVGTPPAQWRNARGSRDENAAGAVKERQRLSWWERRRRGGGTPEALVVGTPPARWRNAIEVLVAETPAVQWRNTIEAFVVGRAAK